MPSPQSRYDIISGGICSVVDSRKPDKLSIVLGCAAKHCGRSQNDTLPGSVHEDESCRSANAVSQGTNHRGRNFRASENTQN